MTIWLVAMSVYSVLPASTVGRSDVISGAPRQ